MDTDDNRRKHRRTPVSLLVQLRFDMFGPYTAEYSVDVSPGGLFVHTPEARPLGTLVHVLLTWKNGTRTLEALGRVARVTPPGGSEPAGLGMEFIDLDDEAKAAVEELCGKGSGPR